MCLLQPREIKSSSILKKHFHPHYDDLSLVSKFIVEYPAKPSSLSLSHVVKLNANDIKVKFTSRWKDTKKYVERHNALYDIEQIYERHTDIALELLIKAILYNTHYQKATLRIAHLFPDERTLLGYILGNYLDETMINQRPLSKFTIDIARQLELIK